MFKCTLTLNNLKGLSASHRRGNIEPSLVLPVLLLKVSVFCQNRLWTYYKKEENEGGKKCFHQLNKTALKTTKISTNTKYLINISIFIFRF